MISSSGQKSLLLNTTPATRKSPNFFTRLRRSNALKGYLFISPWLIGFLLLGLYPLATTFYYSFTQYSLFNDPTWLGLKNYTDILTRDPVFWQASANMLAYVVFSTLITIGGGMGLALLLSRSFPFNHTFRVIFYVPSLMVGVAMGKLFKAVFQNGSSGLANTFIGLFHIAPINWLSDYNFPAMGMVALILINLWFMGGTMLIFIAGLKGISPTYYEAAQIDGGNKWHIFWQVTVPLLAPVIAFNTILALINNIQVFAIPLTIAAAQGAVTGNVVNPLGYHNSIAVYLTYIYRRAFVENDYGYASALSVIVFLITLALSLVVLTTIRFSHYSEGEG